MKILLVPQRKTWLWEGGMLRKVELMRDHQCLSGLSTSHPCDLIKAKCCCHTILHTIGCFPINHLATSWRNWLAKAFIQNIELLEFKIPAAPVPALLLEILRCQVGSLSQTDCAMHKVCPRKERERIQHLLIIDSEQKYAVFSLNWNPMISIQHKTGRIAETLNYGACCSWFFLYILCVWI